MLLDPEIESFSYQLDNEQEVVAALAAALGHPLEQVRAYAAETHDDPEFNQLRALERNAEEGSRGELMSFDTLRGACAVVGERIRRGWLRHVGTTQETLLPALLDASGGTSPTLRAICEERKGSYHRVPMRSRDHIYPGTAITFAVFDAVGEDGG